LDRDGELHRPEEQRCDAEIDTPMLPFVPIAANRVFEFWLQRRSHEVLVRKGEVEITTPQGGTRVGEGQFITVQARRAAQYKIAEAPARMTGTSGTPMRQRHSQCGIAATH